MKKENIIKPVGLKGNDAINRMRELMGTAPINESITRSVVELTKVAPDGNVYAVVRENHEYFIKISKNKPNLVLEDFQYIGGLQNKKDKAYTSYSNALKQLNLKFISLNEAAGKSGQINVFTDDNLITEHHGMKASAKLSAENGVGDNDEYIVDKNGVKLSYDNKEGTEEGEFGDNLVDGKAKSDFEKVKMSENESAIDEMITGKPVKEPVKKGYSIARAINEMDSVIEAVSGKNSKLDDILESLGKDERAIVMEALKKKV